MLYGLAVMAASGFASRLVDRTSNSEQVLFWGTILSGVGLVLMGLMSPALLRQRADGHQSDDRRHHLVGFAHGFINAPVVTHVGQSELGTRIGAIPVTTSYRFLERAGHIAGPIIIAQVFLVFGQDATVLVWIGVGIACLGLLFVANNFRPPVRNLPSEAAAMIAKLALQRTFAVRGIVAALLALSLTATAAAENRPFSSWFKYGSEIDATWDVAGDPAKPNVVSIRRKSAENQAAEKRGTPRRVLVLYPRPSSAYDIAITKILNVFDSKEANAEFTVINFDLNQARGKETLQFAEKNKFDLIFAMGSESTAWLYDNYRGGAIPVVSVCSKDPVELGQMKDYESGSNNNFAFTSLNMPVEVQLAYVMEFKPGLKNLAILVDSKNVSAVQTKPSRSQLVRASKASRSSWVRCRTPPRLTRSWRRSSRMRCARCRKTTSI